jgi:ribosomal protein S18 acetylase RimI-like enzyme
MSDLLASIDAYLDAVPRGGCDVETIGPFTCFFHRVADHPFLSYARPAGRLEGDLGPAIAEVRRRFAERGRRCRFELVEERAPELVTALVAAGFAEIVRYPLMVVTASELRREEVPGVVVRHLREDDDLLRIAGIGARAFGEDEPSADAHADVMRDSLTRARILVAFRGGQPVAMGTHTPIGPLAEIAGIAVEPACWGQRIGGHISAAVTADVFASGCVAAFLTAADERAKRLYGRLGYRVIATGVGAMDPA